MAETAYWPAELRGHHYFPIGSFASFEDALEAVKDHHRNNPRVDAIWRRHEPILRIFKSEGDSWNSTIIEMCPADDRPMMTLATYKVLESRVQSPTERTLGPRLNLAHSV
jgi:hypothetical protein